MKSLFNRSGSGSGCFGVFGVDFFAGGFDDLLLEGVFLGGMAQLHRGRGNEEGDALD